MNLRVISRLFDGSADPLPAGPLVLAGYVVIGAAVLALASIGGWFGLLAIAVVLLATFVLIVRAGSWPAQPSDTGTDTSAE
jgi:hypothetical protein